MSTKGCAHGFVIGVGYFREQLGQEAAGYLQGAAVRLGEGAPGQIMCGQGGGRVIQCSEITRQQRPFGELAARRGQPFAHFCEVLEGVGRERVLRWS